MVKTFVRPPGVTDEAIENYMLTESLGRLIRAGEKGISSIPRTIVGAIHRRAWEAIFCHPTKQLVRFESIEDWIRAKPPEGLDTTVEVVEALIKSSENVEAMDTFQQLVRKGKPAIGKHGGDRRSENAPKPESPTKGGNGVDYLVARLKRDHPELLEEIGQGKRFPSVRAAALEAGIIKPSMQLSVTTPEKLADDLRKRLPEEFWAQFVAVVQPEAVQPKPVPVAAPVPSKPVRAKDKQGLLPIDILQKYFNGVVPGEYALARFYEGDHVDLYAAEAWKAVRKTLEIFQQLPDKPWGRMQWGDKPWQSIDVEDKWEFLDTYITPIIEKGRPLIAQYDQLKRDHEQASLGDLPDKLRILQEYLLNPVESDYRRFAEKILVWKDGGLFRHFSPTWEEFVCRHIKQPVEWIDHVVEGVRILEPTKSTPSPAAIATARKSGPGPRLVGQRTTTSSCFLEDDEVDPSELPGRLRSIQGYVLDAVEDGCRKFASTISDWKENQVFRYFNPTWEEFVSSHIKQPIEWIDHVVEGVRILDGDRSPSC